MINELLLLHRVPTALTLVAFGAPFIGCGVSAAVDDLAQKIVRLDACSVLALQPMPYRNPHRNPKKQLAAIIAAVAGLLLFAGLDIGLKAILLYAVLFGVVLILLAAVDIKTGYLPDVLTMPLLVAGLVVNYWHFFASFTNACLGAAMGYLVIAASNALHQRLRRQAGFGGGDAKMLAAIGAWCGFEGVLLTAGLAMFFAGLTLLVPRQIPRYDLSAVQPVRHAYAAFGPFLAAGGILAQLVFVIFSR